MKYRLGKFPHFDFLVLINNHYLQTSRPGDNVREKDMNEIILYNRILEEFFDNLAIANSLEEIIELALNLTGFLWLRQPFYDGNTRTLRKFLKLLFKELKYDINLSCDEHDAPIIPIFCYDTDKCNAQDVKNLKRRLTKFN